MGNHTQKKVSSCLVKVNLVNLKLNQSPVLQELASNSQLDVSIVFSVKETTLNVSELVHQSTWLLFLNISPLKFWNWLVTLLEITKKTRTIPRHLQLAIRNDEELNKLLGGF